MTTWKIYNRDVIEWAKNYQKARFHALLTDAPYHLTSITKRFGKNGSAPAKFGSDGAFQRASKGFMGTQWDGGDIAFRPETWSAFSEVLYPGAFGMAFSASRNWHRMAVAIEDAGFIIHPTMFFLWVQSQGFPKATRIHKQGDGNFDGHRYGLQALKPAAEPIICLSPDTEILTYQGWKNIETLLDNDLVANWWSNNSEITFEPIKQKIVSEESESIIHIQNRDTDQLVTRHHRVYHKPITGRKKKASEDWQDSLAKDLPYNFKLPLSGFQDGEGIGGDVYASLLGWIWTEGTYENISIRGRTGITITQSSVNQIKVDEIEKTLKNLGVSYKHYAYPRTYNDKEYIQHQFRISGDFARMVRQDLPAKHLTYSLIFRMSVKEKQAFVRSSLLGDGWQDSAGSWHLAQDDRKDNEIFHTMLSTIGKSGTVSDNYVSIKQSGITGIRGARNQKIEESYDGIVWCVETTSGAFLARRNGKIFVTGNCFQKPYEGKPLDNIVSTGAGTLNIDGGRIPTQDEYVINRFEDGMKPFGNGAGHKYQTYIPNGKNKVYGENMGGGVWNESPAGRWPSNLILDDKVAMEQSRFFYQVSTQLDEADPFLYQGKVGPKERNAGLDDYEGNGSISPNAPRISEEVKNKTQKNNHPTLKPINLAKYLAALLLPPAEYAPRRIFVPFSGVASEMIGAGLAGWEHVVGVEFDTENNYVEIAKKRLEYWIK